MLLPLFSWHDFLCQIRWEEMGGFIQQKCRARLLLQTSPALTFSSFRRLFLADAGDDFALSRYVIRVFDLRVKRVDDAGDRNSGSRHRGERSIRADGIGSRERVDAFDVVIVIRVNTLEIALAIESHVVELSVVSWIAGADCSKCSR